MKGINIVGKNVVIEGVMGVGKTTLINALRCRLNIDVIEQDFEHNICLTDFYSNIDCAFQKQMIFLFSNYHILMKAQDSFPVFLSDFCFERSWAISKAILKSDDLDIYKKNYLYLKSRINLQKMIIFLYGNPDKIVQNIKKRGRENELAIKSTYIATQQQSLLRSLSSFDATKVIQVDIDKIDILSDSFLELIIPQIDRFLNRI